jgi:hypothetical protein
MAEANPSFMEGGKAMSFSRSIAWGACALGAVVLVGTVVPIFGQAGPSSPPAAAAARQVPLVDSTRLFMQVEQLALAGNTSVFSEPSKEGFYVVRQKLAPTHMNRPQYYDRDRWVTVLKGTWWVGQGDVFKIDKLVPVREGGFMYQPANLHHYDIAGGSEVILQVAGIGPVKSVHTEVDEKGQPVPIGGPYPGEEGEGGRGYRRRGRGAPPPATQPTTPQQPQ